MEAVPVRWPRGVDGLCFGGDYNPEQWPEETWHEDVALMREARVNLVSLGVFSWSAIEPRQGHTTFGWLDRVMDLLAENGIMAALATPTASPPPWFGLAYPDALPVWPDGTRLTHGSRDTYCPAAPAYRRAAVGIATALAQRYAGHPALAMWHVHNEYGTTCYCDHVAKAFRRWLRQRYTCLEALNEAWTTAFWSQRYGEWEEIGPPRATQYLGNPAQLLDFRRFLSGELFSCFSEQRAVLRELTPQVPVTTNFVFGDWVPVDHRRWAEDLDCVAIDHYPAVPGLPAAEHTAFHADLARSWAGGRPWLLMEQASSTVNASGRLVAKRPGEMARHTVAHVARGSRGAMFFQWRASRGGAEQHHAALVGHAGPGSRVFREAVDLGALLGRLAELDGATVEAPVAILWDAEAWWALLGPGLPSPDLDYLGALQAAHRALLRAGITADFAAPEADLRGYRLVLVPSLYLTSDQGATSVRRYVAGGGHVVVWYSSGVVDLDTRVWIGGHPGAFREVLGVRVEEFHPLLPSDSLPVVPDGASAAALGLAAAEQLTGRVWAEHVHCAGAGIVARYAAGQLAGLPAITRNEYGEGIAWYCSTGLDEADLARLVGAALARAGVTPPAGLPSPPSGVEIVLRRSEQIRWLCVLNHNDEPCSLPLAGTPFSAGSDLVTGSVVTTAAPDEAVIVPAGGIAVIRCE